MEQSVETRRHKNTQGPRLIGFRGEQILGNWQNVHFG